MLPICSRNMTPRKPSPQELFRAVEKNEIALVKSLIESGCDVNAQDKGGSTPLMRASLHGYTGLVGMLIRSGADLNLHDRTGATALHYAAQGQHEDIVRKLIEA